MSFVIPTEFTIIDRLTAPIKGMMRLFGSFGDTAGVAGARADRAFTKLGNGANALFNKLNPLSRINGLLGFAGISLGAAGVIGLFNKIVESASNVENAIASYQGLLGSTEKAKQLVKDLYDLGAATPFAFKDLNTSSQMMIGFGVATEKNVIPMLRMMGDLAQGNAERLGGITLAFSQIKAAGKANMQDVNQLINNGVPILGQLAKQWHMTVGAAREAVSKGKSSSEEITKAFEAMTGKGGMFFNGMAIASKTFSGKMSSLRDSIDMVYAGIGDQLLPLLKEYIDKAAVIAEKTLVWIKNNKELINSKIKEWADKISKAVLWLRDNYQDIIKYIKIYVGLMVGLKVISIAVTIWTYAAATATGSYKAILWLTSRAVFAFNFIQGILAVTTGTVTGSLLASKGATYGVMFASKIATASTWLWVGAQRALTAAFVSSPIGWVVVAVVALGVAVYQIIKHWDDWGASVAFTLGPLGAMISILKTIYDDWNLITAAFEKDGWKGAFSAIGRSIYNGLLYPLQQAVEIMAELTGNTKLAALASQIQAVRDAMYGYDKNETSTAAMPIDGSKGPMGLVNPKQAQADLLLQTINKYTVEKQQVEVIVKAEPGTTATVNNKPGGSIPVLTSTIGLQK